MYYKYYVPLVCGNRASSARALTVLQMSLVP